MPDKKQVERLSSEDSIIYTGDSLRNIAFPIGGIGTGDVLMGGRGNIRALEIFNRAASSEEPYMTFFTLWFREGEKPSVAKVLEGKLPDNSPGPYGVSRRDLAGLSRFESARLTGEYPFYKLELTDPQVPLKINSEIYNPMIPLDVDDSSFPLAVFYWTVENNSDETVSATIAFNAGNPLSNTSKNGTLTNLGNTNSYYSDGNLKGILFSNSENPDSPRYGNIVLATDHPETKVQTAWYEGAWWDDATIFWDDFSTDGQLRERKEKEVWQGSDWYGSGQQTIVGCIAVHVNLKPGERTRIPFYLTWYVPNRVLESSMAFGNLDVVHATIKNFYSTRFGSAADVLSKFREKENVLYNQTAKYVSDLYRSTIPVYAVDAAASNTAALKTNLLMRTEEGWVHGFEGLGENSGCCPGNCEHVWNYAQTMASLYPELERKVREVSFLHDTFENGYQCFRTVFPLGDYWFKNVAADAQMGNIIRVYREWKYSGDTEWLKRLWPKVKLALEFAWKGSGHVNGKYSWQENAFIPWDPDKEGILRGDQHNTYDIDFFGPNMMTGSLYLGALKACSEMASYLGEPDKAAEYEELYNKGKNKYIDLLWNGEYFVQKVEVAEGISISPRLQSPPDKNGKIIPKYQFGDGCLTDQLLGQFISFNAGLGYVIDDTLVQKAMESVYKYNYIDDFTNFNNVQRVYAFNKEGGMVICTWPHGNRPRLPFVYSDEVWTGVEYEAAVNMIRAGLVNEGLKVVETVRDRYRGYNRNPWGEIESGMYYARSLASWAVLPALSGFEYDGVNKSIRFSPVMNKNDFRTFWITGDAWGNFEENDHSASLRVDFGSLTLSEIQLPDHNVSSVRKNDEDISFETRPTGVIQFNNELILQKDESIKIIF